MFILGLPGETQASAQKTIDYAMSLPLIRAQFSVFCPYPGSAYFDELIPPFSSPTDALAAFETFTSYPAFGGNRPIYTPEALSSESLISLQKQAFRRFYFRPATLLKPKLVLSMLKPRTMLDVLRASLDLLNLPSIFRRGQK